MDLIERIKKFLRDFRNPSPRSRPYTIGQWRDDELEYENLKTKKRIENNALPPGADPKWLTEYRTESPAEFLRRTSWTKCHQCANWFKRRVICLNCGEENDIYPNCPHCDTVIRELPLNWENCQTCNALNVLTNTTKKRYKIEQ